MPAVAASSEAGDANTRPACGRRVRARSDTAQDGDRHERERTTQEKRNRMCSSVTRWKSTLSDLMDILEGVAGGLRGASVHAILKVGTEVDKDEDANHGTAAGARVVVEPRAEPIAELKTQESGRESRAWSDEKEHGEPGSGADAKAVTEPTGDLSAEVAAEAVVDLGTEKPAEAAAESESVRVRSRATTRRRAPNRHRA